MSNSLQGFKSRIEDVREEILRKRRAGKLPGDTTTPSGKVEALLSPCRHFTCPLHSRQSGGIYVYFIQDKVEANMAAIHSRHIINKFYTIRSGGI